jgi:hypothetical protein
MFPTHFTCTLSNQLSKLGAPHISCRKIYFKVPTLLELLICSVSSISTSARHNEPGSGFFALVTLQFKCKPWSELTQASYTESAGYGAAEVGHEFSSLLLCIPAPMSVLQGQVRGSSAACRRAAAGPSLFRSAATYQQHQRIKGSACHRILRSKQSDDVEAVPVDPLLGALTTIGLSGTIAVTGSALCGYQIFSTFKWDQPADALLALQISGVLVLLEALLFLPSYSIPASLTEAATTTTTTTSSSSSSSISLQPQKQLVDMAAVKAAGVWSSESWLLLLALYRAVLRRPQVEQLPQQV